MNTGRRVTIAFCQSTTPIEGEKESVLLSDLPECQLLQINILQKQFCEVSENESIQVDVRALFPI